MKLAKVDHYRCDQPAGKWGLSSYVWIPDEMTEEQFGTACEQARTTYLANEQTWKDAAPVHQPDIGVRIASYPETMTVAEMKADHQIKVDAYKAYEAKRSAARKNFATILVESSNDSIKYFWNQEPAVKHDLDWGHHHGTTIDMGATKITDYPPAPDEGDEYDEDYDV